MQILSQGFPNSTLRHKMCHEISVSILQDFTIRKKIEKNVVFKKKQKMEKLSTSMMTADLTHASFLLRHVILVYVDLQMYLQKTKIQNPLLTISQCFLLAYNIRIYVNVIVLRC